MYQTQEKKYGLCAFARHYEFESLQYPQSNTYMFPGTWENGWIHEINPCDGLFVGSAWFTTNQTIDYIMAINEPCLLILCIDSGELTITQKGKPPRRMNSYTQLWINPETQVRLTITKGMHMCFTSVLIFDDCINRYLNANHITYPIRVHDAIQWKSHHIDAPNTMLVMEQIRWGVRGERLPIPTYLCKVIELLCLFAHNYSMEGSSQSRRDYVNWNDEKQLFRVKSLIDNHSLHVPPIQELCQLAQMSESKLRRSFKSLYKKTLYSYTREAVMKRGMQLLADDEYNIKNIATLCGYANAAKFSAAFKSVHGITPSQFRKTFGL